MFKKFRKALWEKRLNKEQIEFDKKHDCKLYGKWRDGRRIYDNGCYCVPFEKTCRDWNVRLYSANGVLLNDSLEMQNILDWHHGFIMYHYRFDSHEFFYDCDGNLIADGDGVFITDEDTAGENLYIIPGGLFKWYILYNHKTRSFVGDGRGPLRFDGIKGEGDKIIGVVREMIGEGEGYGTFEEITNYDMVYVIDRNGNICDTRKENIRKEKDGNQMEENPDA